MDPDQEQPQAKRARLSGAPQQAQGASVGGHQAAPIGVVPSSTTGATVALPSAAIAASQQVSKPSASVETSNAGALASATERAPLGAAAKPANFLADAYEAVHFRAVSAATAEDIAAEVAAGGQPVKVEFMHQHFGDAEQIRGYNGLKITIWIHVRTYHVWVDIHFAAKRPGADKLGAIFDGAFPSGYCRSQEEFVAAAAATAAALPDLMEFGDIMGTVPLPPSAYGVKAPENCSPVEVSVRRFQLSTAPAEVKALHARLEPLLLFTIDGAQFIDQEDPQWELLLPVARAADGGCLVLGLTTLFNFFAYPASCRLRVSQVLVLSPWQGMGLGKALLKLSYDLAQSRGCADLTVEDPTPNLQRVREKLEVEMMRGLDWVAAQARKCLDAVERRETAWPAWEGDNSYTASPTLPHAEEPQKAEPQEQQKAEPQQPVKKLEQAEQDGPQEQAPPEAASPGQVREQGLTSHAFFAALGAVPPPNLELPEGVHEEAVAGAEARWRQRLAAAETAMAVAEAAAEAAPAPAEAAAKNAVASVSGAAVSAPAAGTSTATASNGAGPSMAASGSFAALIPSASFVSAVSRKLKMHQGQIRSVWEALLWSEPGALRRRGVKAALEQLVESRLETQHFSSVGRAASEKVLVDLGRSALRAGDDRDEITDFFMYRPVRRAAAAAAGGSEGGFSTGAFATGRLNLTQVTADDKSKRMDELKQERRQQLELLAAALNAPRRAR